MHAGASSLATALLQVASAVVGKLPGAFLPMVI